MQMQTNPDVVPRGVRHPRRPRRRWPRRLVVGSCLVVALLLLVVGGAYGYLTYRFNQVHKVAVPALAASPASGPFNVLLVGADAQNGGQRADTMIVARVDPSTHRVALLDIPYDYFGPIVGGNGPNKISDALNGGAQDMVATVEKDLGLSINHYMQVSFSGVAAVVNALGGVRLDFPYPSRDTMSGLSVPSAGCQTLDGTQALALVRSRAFSYLEGGSWHYDPSGDFGRIKRQDAFLRAVLHRVEQSVLTDPLRLNSFASTAVHNLTVDQGLGVSTLLQMAEAFHSLGGSDLTTYTLPTQIVNNDGPYGDVLYPVPHLDDTTIATWESSVLAPGTSPGASGTSAGSFGTGGVLTPGPAPSTGGSIVQNRSTPSFDPTPC